MRYSHMIRFDNVEEARRLQDTIDKLEESKSRNLEAQDAAKDCFSESDTEGNDHLSVSRSSACCSAEMSKSGSGRSKTLAGLEELKEDAPLISFLRSSEKSPKMKTAYVEKQNISAKPTEASPKNLSKVTNSQQKGVVRKRVHVILSNDEDEMNDKVECLQRRLHKNPVEGVATSDEFNDKSGLATPACKFQDVQAADSKCVYSTENPTNVEESTCSYKFTSSNPTNPNGDAIRCIKKLLLAYDFATKLIQR